MNFFPCLSEGVVIVLFLHIYYLFLPFTFLRMVLFCLHKLLQCDVMYVGDIHIRF